MLWAKNNDTHPQKLLLSKGQARASYHFKAKLFQLLMPQRGEARISGLEEKGRKCTLIWDERSGLLELKNTFLTNTAADHHPPCSPSCFGSSRRGKSCMGCCKQEEMFTCPGIVCCSNDLCFCRVGGAGSKISMGVSNSSACFLGHLWRFLGFRSCSDAIMILCIKCWGTSAPAVPPPSG